MIDNIKEGMGEKTIVIHPVIYDRELVKEKREFERTSEEGLAEALGLANAINLQIKHSESINVRKVRPATFLGGGSVMRIKGIIDDTGAKLLYIDCNLTPIQQRNLEQDCKVKVIDRTGLILEIFGERAKTKEGSLQVELAALEYQRSRIVRAWTHLERQRGGSGFIGGPGETQKELDRRLIDDRIKKIKHDLESVRKNRELQRNARKREPFPIIALVGYTNAGKSTLFNYLTNADVFAKDLLFATLDTTMRGLKLPSGKKVIFSDTVGFISGLPHHLVAAFRATLEEVQDADVILHIRDISNKNSDAEKEDVERILGDLGINAKRDKRIIDVYNKIDLLTDEEKDVKIDFSHRKDNIVALSALTGEGVGDLVDTIEKILADKDIYSKVSVNISDGAAIAWLYGNANILERVDDENNVHFKFMMEPVKLHRFENAFPYKVKENIE